MKIQQSARVVIVTGTSQGIGQAIAQSYLDNGDIVIGCAFSALEKAANAQKMLAENPEHYFYYSVDVTKTESIKQFVNDAEKLFGRIDVVVSNAGKNVFKGIDCEESDWSHNFDLNLRSHWYLAKCARPALRKSNGVIIVITSNHAFSTMPGCAPYNISKKSEPWVSHLALSIPMATRCGSTRMLMEKWHARKPSKSTRLDVLVAQKKLAIFACFYPAIKPVLLPEPRL